MNKKRKFFQESLRKDVDIKKTISHSLLGEMKKFNKEIQQFAEKTTKSVQEHEK